MKRALRTDMMSNVMTHALRFSCQQQIISIAYAQSSLLANILTLLFIPIYNYHESDLISR